MTIERNRDGPGPQEEGPRLSFGRQATTPGQDETGEPPPVLHGTPTGQGDGSPPGDCGVIATYECDPRGNFREVRLTLCGAPDDDGRRRRIAHDFLWGRFARREDDDGEAYASDRVPVPVLSPSLTGGATAEVEALMPAA